MEKKKHKKKLQDERGKKHEKEQSYNVNKSFKSNFIFILLKAQNKSESNEKRAYFRDDRVEARQGRKNNTENITVCKRDYMITDDKISASSSSV